MTSNLPPHDRLLTGAKTVGLSWRGDWNKGLPRTRLAGFLGPLGQVAIEPCSVTSRLRALNRCPPA